MADITTSKGVALCIDPLCRANRSPSEFEHFHRAKIGEAIAEGRLQILDGKANGERRFD
jgi:hypothetical protein